MAQSSIISTPNQPLYFEAPSADDCGCGQPTNCLLYVPEQQVYSQLTIEPCGTVTVCNNTLGDELILNGDFAANLDNWTVDAGWAWSSGRACATNGQNIGQTIGAGLTDGAPYLVTFTIANYDSNDVSLSLGGTAAGPYNADGTYSVIIVAGAANDDLVFGGSSTFNGCIDDVSLKLITTCWDADETDWTTSVSGACHVAGNTTPLVNTGTTITLAGYYKVTITVSGMTAGTLTCYLGIDPQTPVISTNGTYDIWGIANGIDISFVPSSDFDGCVSGLAVEEYCNNYLFHLLDENNDFVYDMTPFFSLQEDVYNLENFSWDDISLAYGCYTLCLIDCCYGNLIQFDATLIENGDFSAGSDQWASVDTVFAGGQATISSEGYIEQAIKTTHDVGCLRIQFDWSNEGGAGNINVFINGVSQFTEILGGGTGSVDFVTYVTPNAGATIRIYAEPNLGAVAIDNVVVSVPQSCRVYDQCSPCIKYGAEFGCTKMVEGYSDGNAFNFSFDDSNGVNWFKLSMRLRCDLLHPTYEQEQDDYTFSTGSSSVNFGQSAKFQSLYFSPIAEYKHDVIALIKVSDFIQIDSVDYFARKGDYVPEWNKSSNADLAPSRIEVKKKDQTLFNNNCG